MVKRKRVTSLSNPEEKTANNGVTFESQCFENNEEQSKIIGPPTVTDVSQVEGENGGGGHAGSSCATKQVKQAAEMDNADEEDGVGGGLRTASGLTLRSRVRAQKRSCRDSSPVPVNPKKVDVVGSDKLIGIPEKTKTRRSWEQWSIEDKNAFFDALCEYGKDFENITNYIIQKSRKKGVHAPQIMKNKDQVRYFYYRTWNAISKHLNISNDVKKKTRELYGLINYGELRKKIRGRIDEKNGQKLNELVHKGMTSIRCKGKNLHVKTPICRALKRLNNIEDARVDDNPKLPSRIDVEFRPRSNRAWSRVQSFAKNPRLRMNVNLQRRMSTIIGYLQRRWTESSLKQRNELLKSLGQNEVQAATGVPLLRVMPRSDATVRALSLEATTDTASSSVKLSVELSLENYQRKVQRACDFAASMSPTSAVCKKGLKGKARSSGPSSEDAKRADDKPNCSNVNVASAAALVGQPANVGSGDKTPSELVESVSNGAVEKMSDATDPSDPSESVAPHELTLLQLLALETAVTDPVSQSNPAFFTRTPSFLCDTAPAAAAATMSNGAVHSEDCGPSTTAVVDDVVIEDVGENPAVDVDSVRRGWTMSDCSTLTVGEIYMLLGCPSKLMLEYEWEYQKTVGSPEGVQRTGRALASANFTAVMSRLLAMAATSLSDLGRSKLVRQALPAAASSCRCTHQCGAAAAAAAKPVSSKSSSVARSPSVARGATKVPKLGATKAALGGEAVNPAPASSSASSLIGSGGATATRPPADIFRKPASVPPAQNRVGPTGILSTAAEKAFKEQLDKFLPQHRKAKGRMRKSMVVQRELPLLPKAGPAHAMMAWRIIPSASQLSGSFMPVLSNHMLTSGVTTLSQPSTLAKVVRFGPAAVAPTVGPLITASVSATLKASNPREAALNVISIPGSNVGQPCLAVAAVPPPPPPSIVATPLSSAVDMARSAGNDVLLTTSVPSFAKCLMTSSAGFQTVSSTSGVLPDLSCLGSVSSLTMLERGCGTRSVCFSSSSGGGGGSGGLQSVPPIMSISESRSSLSISPPMISSLLDISLSGSDAMPLVDGVHLGSEGSSDKLLDVSLGNSNSFGGLIDMTIGDSVVKSVVDGAPLTIPSLSGDGDHRSCTPVNSPTNSLFKVTSPGLEGHWLNGDTSDFSLSNLLSHLESPVKMSTALSSAMSHADSLDTITRLAPDMDSQLHCLISESSVDYIAKFEDLAAQINTNDGPKKL